MTSPAIKLARECGATDFTNCGGESQVTYILHTKQLERFYTLAQAQALRDAAEKFTFDCECGCPCDCYGPATAKFQALRMAEELEKCS